MALRAVSIPSQASDVTASAVVGDNELLRGDGGARGVQGSGKTLSDEATVNTTDATVTTLATITVPTDDRILVTAHVKATRTGGVAGTAGDAAGYIIHAMLQNLAGTAEIIATQVAALTAEDVSAYACVIDVTGATARIRVTGVADTNITWVAVYETY
jgi:hypothetical protein